jgi:hypothetical protein
MLAFCLAKFCGFEFGFADWANKFVALADFPLRTSKFPQFADLLHGLKEIFAGADLCWS